MAVDDAPAPDAPTSVTFTSPDGQYTRVAATPRDIVKMRYDGWSEKPAEEAAAQSEPLPEPTALKSEWVQRAEALGIDVTGMKKAEIQEAVEAKVAESDTGPNGVPEGAPGVGGQTGSATAPSAAEVDASLASKPVRR